MEVFDVAEDSSQDTSATVLDAGDVDEAEP
jgi:hypothetical protein